ncbi:MAG: hypothetical protein B6244_09890 [Candidatus Cloacimonetes bacterium 4572_55]|nr:MAG: hypothetical protein B6244_09890 [Candidatus Cloacimonetes bacterium 4572_55]
MISTEARDLIIRELPRIVEEDLVVQQMVINLFRKHFADKNETDNRFDRVLNEIRCNREESQRKWDENQKKWDESQRKSDEMWAKNQEAIENIYGELDGLRKDMRRLENAIGGLGARWGIQSEASFRNGLRAILAESFDVVVINVNEFDHTGVVFGRPDQIELDIIIKNSIMIICEIKSSVSKGEVYQFERKARFYEEFSNRKAQRLIIISPMFDKKAKPIAQKLGIEVFTHSEDVLPYDI